MPLEPAVKRLAALLKHAARKKKRSLQSLSVAVGYSRFYLSEVLRGSARISFEVVLQLANELEIHPARLWGEVYDFADLLPNPGESGERTVPTPVDVVFEVNRLRDRLYLKVAESDLSQRELSRRLGEHPDFVHQVVTGRVELRVQTVLRILEALPLEAGAFFAELHGVFGRLAGLAALEEELFRGISRRELYTFFQAKTTELRTILTNRAAEREVAEVVTASKPEPGAEKKKPKPKEKAPKPKA